MKSTENYNLSLYEANDTPNLLDGYNNSMNKIDKALQVTNNTVDTAAEQTSKNSSAISALQTLHNTDITAIHEIDADQDTLINNNKTAIAAETKRSKAAEASLINNRAIILFGDSFSTGIYPTDSSASNYSTTPFGWGTYIKNHAPKNIKIYFGSNTVEKGNSGFNSSKPWEQTAKNMATDGTISDPNSITEIWCLGGTNETANSTLTSSISSFCSTCASLYPNANIYIGVLGSNIASILVNVSNYYQQCNRFGASYVPSTLNLMCRREFISSDGVHLTVDGYKKYAGVIYNLIIGKQQGYHDRWSFNISSDALISTSHTVYIENVVTDQDAYFWLRESASAYAPRFKWEGTSLNLTDSFTVCENVMKEKGTTLQYPSPLGTFPIKAYCGSGSDAKTIAGIGSVYYEASDDKIYLYNIRLQTDFQTTDVVTRLDLYMSYTPVHIGQQETIAAVS